MSTRQIERLLSRKQVREITTLSYAQIARLEKAGKFPPRIRLTDHPRGRVAWLYTAIFDWINSRI